MTSFIQPLNDYVFKPLYKSARKLGLSQQASLYVSHVPGALAETSILWLMDWKLALGIFLVSEAIIPKLAYIDHQKKVAQRHNKESCLEQLVDS
ncbi:hypothetical protein HYV89_03370 [Candidatus Woesearchaeota archaeon]|nr:hypothetical protein [Candidatus Woesearchaeota archaeon]